MYIGDAGGLASLHVVVETEDGKATVVASDVTESWPISDTVMPGKTSLLAERTSQASVEREDEPI
jgi:hypothetical protein